MRNARLHNVLLALAVAVMLPALAGAAVSETPTFHKDIEPILQRSCQVCHRPDNMAPMSLMSYQETRPWARSIKNKVETRAMPPWHLDRRIGIQDFKNDPSLTEAEIATIVTPNLPELEVLTGRTEIADEDMFEAAKELADRHGVQVLAKGGHAGDETQVVDRIASPSCAMLR